MPAKRHFADERCTTISVNSLLCASILHSFDALPPALNWGGGYRGECSEERVVEPHTASVDFKSSYFPTYWIFTLKRLCKFSSSIHNKI